MTRYILGKNVFHVNVNVV